MRAALYARYSTDLQSTASLADQYRLCEDRAAALNIEVVARHGDQAISGSTPVAQRPGGRAMLADALAGRIDALFVESLDRLSRDQVELERIVRRLEHQQIRIIGVSDGYDSAGAGRKVIRAVRGIVAELYLDDLRAKVHRGLVGKVSAGFAVTGRSFGYRIVRNSEAGSHYEIDDREARWVREIFERYAGGQGVARIAHDLNGMGAPSPRGGTWVVSALYGSPVKGSGVLNNELYIGRAIWNRSQWLKDPDTGKRRRIDRPRDEWMVTEVPQLRIVNADLWAAVRRRIDDGRDATGHKRAFRPARTLFGGLLACPHCGGPVIAISATHYGCNARKDRGAAVCAGFTIRRTLVDQRLLSVVHDELLSPEALIEFDRACAAVRAGRSAGQTTPAARIQALSAEIGRLVDAIASVGISDALAARLRAAEAERTQLQALATRKPTAGQPREALRRYLADLGGALEHDRERARALLAELLGRMRLELRGEGEVWAQMQTGRALEIAAGQSITVVAETRMHRYRWLRIR